MFARLRRSEFLRNVATLMSGTMVAQLLPLALSPVMSRLFTPSDYGVLGLYMACTGLLSVLVTSQYNHAIMVCERDEEAVNVIALCLAVTVATSLLALVGVVVALRGDLGGVFLLGPWVWFVPFSTACAGLYNVLNYWTNRRCRYKRLAVSRVLQSLSTLALQLPLGVLIPGPSGLMVGLLAGQAVATLILLGQVWREDRGMFAGKVNRGAMREAAVRHRRFAYYLLPGDLINTFNSQIPTFVLTRLAGAADVGRYNYTQRMLGLPLGLISTSVLDVFKQRAVSDYHRTGNCRDIFLKTFRSLALLGIVPLLVTLCAAPEIFSFVFGSRWREAGVYAQLLSVMFYLKLVVGPLSYVYYITGRQKEDLALQTLLIVGSLSSLWLGHRIFGSAYYMILFYSANYSLFYLLLFFRSYRLSGGRGCEGGLAQAELAPKEIGS